MRIFMIVALMLSFSAYGQRVKENVKQQAVINGSNANVNTFDVQAPAKPKK